MSTYTCPHCGERGLSTQRRHWCPKLPSLSIPLGPPRSMDPIANEYISRLTRELEAARERERVNRLAAIVALSSAESVISWAIKHYVRFGRMDNTLGQVRVALRILGKPPVDSHTVALLMEEPSWSFGQAVRRALAKDTEASG